MLKIFSSATPSPLKNWICSFTLLLWRRKDLDEMLWEALVVDEEDKQEGEGGQLTPWLFLNALH